MIIFDRGWPLPWLPRPRKSCQIPLLQPHPPTHLWGEEYILEDILDIIWDGYSHDANHTKVTSLFEKFSRMRPLIYLSVCRNQNYVGRRAMICAGSDSGQISKFEIDDRDQKQEQRPWWDQVDHDRMTSGCESRNVVLKEGDPQEMLKTLQF